MLLLLRALIPQRPILSKENPVYACLTYLLVCFPEIKENEWRKYDEYKTKCSWAVVDTVGWEALINSTIYVAKLKIALWTFGWLELKCAADHPRINKSVKVQYSTKSAMDIFFNPSRPDNKQQLFTSSECLILYKWLNFKSLPN